MSFKPIPLNRPSRPARWRWLLGALLVLAAVAAYLIYTYRPRFSGRWAQYLLWQGAPGEFSAFTFHPAQRCGDAPFAFPTRGVIFGLWDQSYHLGNQHQGIDIFAGTDPGITPVYAAYPGHLTRLDDWRASLIIRLPQDPLEPGRQIWTYYTHLGDSRGNSFVSPDFPPGTQEVFVEAGTFLGYQGDYSGDPLNPTGVHLHFSIVKDDGRGNFLNELEIRNTIDPSPYFNLPLDHTRNPDRFPTCTAAVAIEPWDLLSEDD